MKLAYREFGEGRPLIILHGLFGQSDNWNTLAKQFATNGFRVFTIDQRNHGLSPHSEDWNYEVMAADLKEFISDHSITSPILIGHSMGGKTVLFFEKNHPGIASQLVLVDIAPRAYAPHHDEVIEALNAVNLGQISGRKEAEAILSSHLHDAGTRQFLLKNLYWKDEVHKQLDWRFNLKTITENYNGVGVAVPFYTSRVKTLVIRGQKSAYVNESDIEDYKRRFPAISFETIQNAAHWVHAEKPQEFFNVVLAFIKDAIH